MSRDAIVKANETHLKALTPAFPTAWENVNFKPPEGPFQVPTHLFAEPDDRTIGGPFLQRGILTVTLAYPTNQGRGAAQSKAEDVALHFYKGLSLPIDENTSLVVERTPEITGGAVEGDRFIIRVRIRFFAYIDRE
jgi:hypothetical protein